PPTLPTTRRRDAARILLAQLAFLPVFDRTPSTRCEKPPACRRARKCVRRRSRAALATSSTADAPNGSYRSKQATQKKLEPQHHAGPQSRRQRASCPDFLQ